MKIVVSADVHVYSVRPPDPNDSWDTGDTAGYVSDVSAWPSRDWESERHYGGYSHWSGDLDAAPGDYVYAVVADYESGSTFGRDGGQASIVDVFTDVNTADALAQVAENNASYSFDFGDKSYYAPWVGYFESLNNMKVWAVKVKTL